MRGLFFASLFFELVRNFPSFLFRFFLGDLVFGEFLEKNKEVSVKCG